MEPPTCFDADAVRTEKAKVLQAVRRFDEANIAEDIVRGQYVSGRIGEKNIMAYKDSANVAPNSTTETYVALKLMIDNWRWAGVPFYLRTGKALRERTSEIAIRFKQAPYALFRDTSVTELTPNDLVLNLQPEEGVTLGFGAKVPGPKIRMEGVEMRFDYREHFNAAPSTGYETLLYDCMIGDTTLFKRAEEIEANWEIVQPLLDAEYTTREPSYYPAGTDGPSAADALLARDRRKWRPLASCENKA